jgi:hypothetical protein
VVLDATDVIGVKPAAVLARVPRAEIAGVTLGGGISPGLSLLFDDGQAWSFDVTPVTKERECSRRGVVSGRPSRNVELP